MTRSSVRRPILVWCHLCREYFDDADRHHACTTESVATKQRAFVFPPKPTEAHHD